MHGLKPGCFKLSDTVLEKIIQDYTRESGVRELDRQLASIMRYQAKELVIKGKLKATITNNDVEKILGKPRYSNDLYKIANMPGVAVGRSSAPASMQFRPAGKDGRSAATRLTSRMSAGGLFR
jgi:ATP-dependent Lon protease